YGSGSPFSWRGGPGPPGEGGAGQRGLLGVSTRAPKTPPHPARGPPGHGPPPPAGGGPPPPARASARSRRARHPPPPPPPPGAAGRARVRIEELECLLYFADRFLTLARQVFFTPSGERDAARVESARAELREQLGSLEARASGRGGEYLVGGLSRADLTWLPF